MQRCGVFLLLCHSQEKTTGRTSILQVEKLWRLKATNFLNCRKFKALSQRLENILHRRSKLRNCAQNPTMSFS